MNKTTFWSIILTLVVGVVLGFLLRCQLTACGEKEPQVQIITDTVTYIDTVRYNMPVPKDSIVIRYRTITDTLHIKVGDKDTSVVTSAIIPITQKEYRDTTYRAWVSGYEPSLDSIHVFSPTTTIERTILQTKYKANRLGIGIQGGVGYTPNKIQPYIGIGIQYNIFSW